LVSLSNCDSGVRLSKDKFGVSWQVVPIVLPDLLCDPDPEKSGRVMCAMLTMKKLDIGALVQAHERP
jgi:predicted 3-demethylubiquinone-9 3-methyltransferase (glyoxalase superfamily)